MKALATRVLPWVVALFIGCCIVQVFLAGLGVFDDPKAFLTHASFAYVFGWLTLVMLILAIAGRTGRAVVGLAALVLVQFALQSVLVGLRVSMPVVAALHPLNGFAIILVAILELRYSLAVARALPATAASAKPSSEAGAAREP